MREPKIRTTPARSLALAAALIGALLLTGCGTPGAPQPPSLKLPDRVVDLAATRTGNQVALTWTMPKKNTDRLLIKGEVSVRVCRKEQGGVCVTVPSDLSFAPKASATFAETLPAELALGPLRPLAYFVELKNSKGRSAGLSNAATVLAGQAPGPVTGLSAEIRKAGVVLHWTAERGEAGGAADASTVIRLHRTLLTPAAQAHPSRPEANAAQGMLAAPREPLEQNLLVEPTTDSELARHNPAQDGTIDKSIRFGATYEYRAQRVARATVGANEPGAGTLELAGPLSDPVRVEALDIFPPEIPNGLAAVAVAGDTLGGPAIDLSWQPVSDADLAGYAVYRREGNEAHAAWQRIAAAAPIVGPAFHDAHVQSGQTYRYAVTSIDQKGHESARSSQAQETVPSD